MTVDELIAYDQDHRGGAGTAPEEKLFVYSLVRLMRPRRVLEVGVSRGHLTCWLALALRHNGGGRLVSVDNWSRAHGGEASSPRDVKARLEQCGLLDLVTIHSSDSLRFLREQKRGTFDFSWIDGDHSYEGALADIREAVRITDGTVAVHDVHQSYDGPRRACADIGRPVVYLDGFRGIALLRCGKGA